MKAQIILIATFLLGCTTKPTQELKGLPSGVFYPDVERSMAWMLENRFSHKTEKELDEIALKLRKALYEGELLQHSWNNGQLEASVGNWIETYSREWEKLEFGLFRYIKPAGESNTELVALLRITGHDTYYIEITVNEVVTKEYWVKKNEL